MSEMSFDQLMQRYEMGLAYKAITALMGPNPQLVAFINFDKVTEDNVGLESFDIMTQHQQILTNIEADPSLQLALEDLRNNINQTGRYLVKGGMAAWMINWFTGVPYVGKLSAAAIFAGYVAVKTTEPDVEGKMTYSRRSFDMLAREFGKALETETMIAKSIPGDFSVAAWKQFHTEVTRQYNKSFNIGKISLFSQWFLKQKNRIVLEAGKNTHFGNSGWDVATFKQAVTFLDTSIKEVEQARKSFEPKISKVNDWVKNHDLPSDPKARQEAKEVMRYIHDTVGLTGGVFDASDFYLKQMHAVTTDVSDFFVETKKG